jgi:predicted nucleic acid-binding protein
MRRVFADTNYLLALINRNDHLHHAAMAAQKNVKSAQIVTTDEVLSEFLNYCSSRGPSIRLIAAQMVDGLRSDPKVTVVEQSRKTFDGGLQLYKNRHDKEYSLADCISFQLMMRDGIKEVLTHDHHFKQEGFTILL